MEMLKEFGVSFASEQPLTAISIEKVEQTKEATESEGVNELTVTLTNGDTSKFQVRNGKKGDKGDKGDAGDKDAVLYTVQNLDTEKQAQARKNIGASAEFYGFLFVEELTDTIYNTSVKDGEVSAASSQNYRGQIIEVSAGDIFKIKGKGGSSMRLWAFAGEKTNAEGTKVKYVIDHAEPNAIEKTEKTITAPTGAKWLYVAFSIDKQYPHSLYKQANLALENQQKITELTALIQQNFAELTGSNVLYGKKYYAAGDSYTEWSDATYPDGRYKGQFVTYDREIRLRNNMGGENKGVGGSTITQYEGEAKRSFSKDEGRDENGEITETTTGRYLEIPKDTDYLTIAFGINDSGALQRKEIELGELEDTENTTFYGAWDKVLKYYAKERPAMKIGIICFLRQGQDEIHQAIKNIAKYYGVPLLDFYGGEDTPMYIDGKAYITHTEDNPNPLVSLKKAYWSGHANDEKDEDGKLITTGTFRGKTYNLRQPGEGEGLEAHPGYRAHIDESTVIEEFLRRL